MQFTRAAVIVAAAIMVFAYFGILRTLECCFAMTGARAYITAILIWLIGITFVRNSRLPQPPQQ